MCVCVCMSTYLVVRVIDNARTDISSVLKVSRPIWLKGWKAAPVPHLGKDPKWGEGGDDVFVAMNLHVSSLLSQTAFSRRSLLLSCYDTQATNFDTTAMRLKCDNNMIVPHNTLPPLTQNGVFPNKLHKFVCFLARVCINL